MRPHPIRQRSKGKAPAWRLLGGLAATGICIVPLSSFNTSLQGFRVTLLEKDPVECERIYRTLAEKIGAYLNS